MKEYRLTRHIKQLDTINETCRSSISTNASVGAITLKQLKCTATRTLQGFLTSLRFLNYRASGDGVD